jgi:hypothetical protein
MVAVWTHICYDRKRQETNSERLGLGVVVDGAINALQGLSSLAWWQSVGGPLRMLRNC